MCEGVEERGLILILGCNTVLFYFMTTFATLVIITSYSILNHFCQTTQNNLFIYLFYSSFLFTNLICLHLWFIFLNTTECYNCCLFGSGALSGVFSVHPVYL